MKDINFLPWREMLRQERRKRMIVAVLSYVVIFLILAITLHIYYARKVSQQVRQNQLTSQQLSVAKSEVSKLQKLIQRNDQIKARIETLTNLDYDRYFTVKLFNELAEITPKGISLAKIERKDNALILAGTANSNDAVAELVAAVKKSPIFLYPALGEVSVHRSGSEATIKFSLTAGLLVPEHQKEFGKDEKEGSKKTK